ncbi:MAG: hypothetical protein JWM11_5543, partial [Planctomycetaceae bacterium]|nr:hypothetical protein [Planctomycetaceae bacterium]
MASTNADDGEAAVKWYVVDESGGLLGPFSTTELAVQAQSGQLTGDQQLRKVGSSVTVAARRLVFLKFPAQAASPKKTGVSSPARSSREPLQRSVAADNDVNGVESIDPEEDSAEPARRGPWSQSISDQIGSKFLILSVGLVLGFFAGGWWNSQPDIFPAPPGHVTEAGNVVVRKEDSRPAKPQILTLRNVPKDRRVPLPGLEGIDP